MNHRKVSKPLWRYLGLFLRLLVEMLLHVKIHLWPDFHNYNYGIIIRQLVIDYSGDHCFLALIKILTNILPIHSCPKCGKSFALSTFPFLTQNAIWNPLNYYITISTASNTITSEDSKVPVPEVKTPLPKWQVIHVL